LSTVFDVAKCILDECSRQNGENQITTWKLQKLVYYSQAWAVVWDDEPIFEERIEAWANGPVVPELYTTHRGDFKISKDSIAGDSSKLSNRHKETIEEVVRFYGSYSPHQLSELTHNEDPWIKAREGQSPGERGSNEITLASLSEYYSTLSQ